MERLFDVLGDGLRKILQNGGTLEDACKFVDGVLDIAEVVTKYATPNNKRDDEVVAKIRGFQQAFCAGIVDGKHLS